MSSNGTLAEIVASRQLAGPAYLAACAAVSSSMGEAPPAGPGVQYGGRRHSSQQARLRKLAIYVAVCAFGVRVKHVAPHAGVTRRTAGEWVQEVEDSREDPAVDREIEQLTILATAHLTPGFAQ